MGPATSALELQGQAILLLIALLLLCSYSTFALALFMPVLRSALGHALLVFMLLMFLLLLYSCSCSCYSCLCSYSALAPILLVLMLLLFLLLLHSCSCYACAHATPVSARAPLLLLLVLVLMLLLFLLLLRSYSCSTRAHATLVSARAPLLLLLCSCSCYSCFFSCSALAHAIAIPTCIATPPKRWSEHKIRWEGGRGEVGRREVGKTFGVEKKQEKLIISGREDVFFVHPENGFNGFSLNWCISGY